MKTRRDASQVALLQQATVLSIQLTSCARESLSSGSFCKIFHTCQARTFLEHTQSYLVAISRCDLTVGHAWPHRPRIGDTLVFQDSVLKQYLPGQMWSSNFDSVMRWNHSNLVNGILFNNRRLRSILVHPCIADPTNFGTQLLSFLWLPKSLASFSAISSFILSAISFIVILLRKLIHGPNNSLDQPKFRMYFGT